MIWGSHGSTQVSWHRSFMGTWAGWTGMSDTLIHINTVLLTPSLPIHPDKTMKMNTAVTAGVFYLLISPRKLILRGVGGNLATITIVENVSSWLLPVKAIRSQILVKHTWMTKNALCGMQSLICLCGREVPAAASLMQSDCAGAGSDSEIDTSSLITRALLCTTTFLVPMETGHEYWCNPVVRRCCR